MDENEVIWALTDSDVSGMSDNDITFLCEALSNTLKEYKEQI